jgi:hypothetical protein
MPINGSDQRGTTRRDGRRNWLPWLGGGLLILILAIVALRGIGEAGDRSPTNASVRQDTEDTRGYKQADNPVAQPPADARPTG